jgi:autophagy-related protein 13
LILVDTSNEIIASYISLQKTPFASGNANSELGAFYLECKSAPQLKTFSEQPTLAEQVRDIRKTLEAFETNVQEYEEMLNSLCLSDNNN